MRKFDLHLHTTASDGSDAPIELLAIAKEAGIEVISITDHDTLAGCIEVINMPQNDVKVITGIEFSCHYHNDEDFDCHILGYGFDPESPELLAAINHGREMRLAKLHARLEYLESRFGMRFSEEELSWLHSLNSAAKPHLAGLIVNRGFADSIADAIDKYLKGDGFPDDRIDASLAIRSIISAGGIPVYAHPIGGEREKRLTKEELIPRVKALVSVGLQGMECYYSRYSSADEELLSRIAKENGLHISAGSDYHGKNKTVVLGRLCSEGDIELSETSLLTALLS